jgi:hypothetical protein
MNFPGRPTFAAWRRRQLVQQQDTASITPETPRRGGRLFGVLIAGGILDVALARRRRGCNSLVPTQLVLWVMLSVGWLATAGAAAAPSPAADVAVSAIESQDPVLVDGALTYTVRVTNLGPRRATRVRLALVLSGPAALAARPAARPGSCTVQGDDRAVCALGALANKRKASVVVVVDPAELGTVSLSATVSTASVDRRRRNNRATQTTRVLGLDTVQGRGVRSTAGDAGYPTVTTEIDGRGDPTAGGRASGTFSVQYAAISASPARGSDLRGRVVCVAVDVNRATVGGVVESSNSGVYPAGTAVRFAITDNGEPGAGRDSLIGFLGGEPTCAPQPAEEQPLIEGDFVVRDGSP